MTRSLPRLCAITDRALAGGARHECIVRELLDAGVEWIQLREKKVPSGEFLRDARSAIARARQSRALVLVNDRADIALAACADGVHLGRADLPPEAARSLLGAGAVIGFSSHTIEEGIAAASLPIDYIAIGPVFPTATKPDAEPVVGLEAVRRLAASVALPIVGIGGIDATNAPQVLAAGAASVAVIGALYRETTIREAARRLIDLLAIR